MFLPAYGLMLIVGLRGDLTMIVGLLLADVATFVVGWLRLRRRGFFEAVGPPSLSRAREVAAFGWRAQIGGALSLLNLRLDFALLGAFAGPAVLGPYAIASKFAELLRLPAMALTYILYPRFARSLRSAAAVQARALIGRAGVLTAIMVAPLWVAATYLLPLVYGQAFASAVDPAHILLLGLAGEGVAGVITAFLYGIGRPGLNSVAMAVGLVVTVVLDLLLIPRFGAVGAAWASSVAYLTTTGFLFVLFWFMALNGSSRAAPVSVHSGVGTS